MEELVVSRFWDALNNYCLFLNKLTQDIFSDIDKRLNPRIYFFFIYNDIKGPLYDKSTPLRIFGISEIDCTPLLDSASSNTFSKSVISDFLNKTNPNTSFFSFSECKIGSYTFYPYSSLDKAIYANHCNQYEDFNRITSCPDTPIKTLFNTILGLAKDEFRAVDLDKLILMRHNHSYEKEDILRKSGQVFWKYTFSDSDFCINKGNTGTFTYEMLNNLSNSFDESRECKGKVLFTELHYYEEKVTKTISFSNPIPINYNNLKYIRKLLEIAKDKHYLISFNNEIVGFGQYKSKYIDREGILEISFIGHNAWSLIYKHKPIFNVHNGIPKISIPISYETRIENLYKSEFPSAPKSYPYFIKLYTELINCHHGAMIVILHKKEAADQARHIGKASTLINPVRFKPKMLKYIANIDGAIVMDHLGKCYAIGAILDGLAGKTPGNPARGARYNSAIKYSKYMSDNGIKCLIILISEDGDICFIKEGIEVKD